LRHGRQWNKSAAGFHAYLTRVHRILPGLFVNGANFSWLKKRPQPYIPEALIKAPRADATLLIIDAVD
jgi:hypothetical protein